MPDTFFLALMALFVAVIWVMESSAARPVCRLCGRGLRRVDRRPDGRLVYQCPAGCYRRTAAPGRWPQ